MRKQHATAPRAVVDTNVFVSATILKRGDPYELLRLLRANRFRIVTSAQQRRELERALSRPRIMKYGVGQTEIDSLLRLLQRRSDIVAPPHPSPVNVRDANDEHILGIAEKGQADYLVTGDKDLLVLVDNPNLGQVRIIPVTEFLLILHAIELRE